MYQPMATPKFRIVAMTRDGRFFTVGNASTLDEAKRCAKTAAKFHWTDVHVIQTATGWLL